MVPRSRYCWYRIEEEKTCLEEVVPELDKMETEILFPPPDRSVALAGDPCSTELTIGSTALELDRLYTSSPELETLISTLLHLDKEPDHGSHS